MKKLSFSKWQIQGYPELPFGTIVGKYRIIDADYNNQIIIERLDTGCVWKRIENYSTRKNAKQYKWIEITEDTL